MRTQLIRSTNLVKQLNRPVVATIGSFDGIHRGHQKILRIIKEEVSSIQSISVSPISLAYSLSPHPAVVLGHAEEIPLISRLHTRLALLSKLEVDYLALIRFNRALSTLSAEEFLDTYFIKAFPLHTLVVGADAAVGQGRRGDVPFMQSYLKKHGIKVLVVDTVGGESKVGSRSVRALIKDGAVSQASQLLGYPFTLVGRVVHGSGRGAGIGFPTANIHPSHQVIPAKGVYCAFLSVEGFQYPCVVNIGVRPTFGENTLKIEAHVLGTTSLQLYGKRVSLHFIEQLRTERTFASVDLLKAQIGNDIERAERLLAQSNFSARSVGLLYDEN